MDAERGERGERVSDDGPEVCHHALQLGAVVAQLGAYVILVDDELQAGGAAALSHLGPHDEFGFYPGQVEALLDGFLVHEGDGVGHGGEQEGVYAGALPASVLADDGAEACRLDALGHDGGVVVGQVDVRLTVGVCPAGAGVGVLVAFEDFLAAGLLAVDVRVHHEGHVFLADGVAGDELRGDDEPCTACQALRGDVEGEVHVDAVCAVGRQDGVRKGGRDGPSGSVAMGGATGQEAGGRQGNERYEVCLFHDQHP